MKLHLVEDPAFARTFWCRQYERGIHQEASQNGIELAGAIPAGNGQDAIVCLIGSSLPWIRAMRAGLETTKARIILLSPFNPDLGQGFSHVAADYRSMTRILRSHFLANGRTHTAVFGSNPSSSTDALKVACCRESFGSCRIFENLGNLEESCAEFLAERGGFDSVVCCSDLVAVELVRHLKSSGVRIPEQIWVTGFGDTALAAKVTPSITTVACDYVTVGRYAVKIAMMLARNAGLSSISMTVQGSLVPRESTGGIAAPTMPDGRPTGELPSGTVAPDEVTKSAEIDFLGDRAVGNLLAMEHLASHCEEVDFRLLEGLARGTRYGDIAEACNMSENTAKYRVRRMLDLAGVKSRQELLAFAAHYLDLPGSEKR